MSQVLCQGLLILGNDPPGMAHTGLTSAMVACGLIGRASN